MLGSYEQKKNLSSAIRKAKSCLQYIGIAKRLIFFIFVKIEKKKCKAKITKIQISVFYHSFSLKTNFTQYNNQKWRRSKSEKKNLFSKSVFHDVTHAMLVWRTNMRKLNSFLVMAFFFTVELVKLLVT